jgi:hypothetical protein
MIEIGTELDEWQRNEAIRRVFQAPEGLYREKTGTRCAEGDGATINTAPRHDKRR